MTLLTCIIDMKLCIYRDILVLYSNKGLCDFMLQCLLNTVKGILWYYMHVNKTLALFISPLLFIGDDF